MASPALDRGWLPANGHVDVFKFQLFPFSISCKSPVFLFQAVQTDRQEHDSRNGDSSKHGIPVLTNLGSFYGAMFSDREMESAMAPILDIEAAAVNAALSKVSSNLSRVCAYCLVVGF